MTVLTIYFNVVRIKEISTVSLNKYVSPLMFPLAECAVMQEKLSVKRNRFVRETQTLVEYNSVSGILLYWKMILCVVMKTKDYSGARYCSNVLRLSSVVRKENQNVTL